MSPLSKSKSKSVMKASKDQQKASSKTSSLIGGAVPVGTNNNGLSVLNTLGSISGSISASQSNGRFTTNDEREDNSGGSLGNTSKYETLSNNGSCSGESEGQKDKVTSTGRPESIPGCDTDKRDKIRQKNEKKHQRQKERRAQELHERCIHILMSKKLDVLTQQLEAMGFAAERATTALLLNDGRVEDSIAWLVERVSEEEANTTKNGYGTNMKIDISDELAKIAEMEMKCSCTKQEAERAIVSCEGDLERATEILRAQKLDNPSSPSKLSESQDSPPVVNGSNKLAMVQPIKNTATSLQGKPTVSLVMQQPKRDEKDLNNSKIVVNGASLADTGGPLQQTRRILSRSDWAKPQAPIKSDRRWSNASSSPSIPYNGTLLQAGAVPGKVESHNVLENNEPNINPKAGVLREPVIMMQRPQPVNTLQNQLATSSSISSLAQVTAGWDPIVPSGLELLKATTNNLAGSMSSMGPPVGSLLNPNQAFYPPKHQQPYVSSPADSARWSDNGSWSNVGTSNVPSSLAVPSSVNLYTGWGSASSYGSSASLDWNTDGSMAIDYTSIDWSLNSTPLLPDNLPSMRSDRLRDTWSTAFMETKVARPSMSSLGMGLQEGNLRAVDHASAGSCEWTTPFAGNDLFRVPRQFVTSPSLGHR